MEKTIIPAITSIKGLEQFLTTSHPIGIVMSIHVSILARVVERIHQAGKKAWVHLDLLPGISSDEYGVEYVIQHFAVDVKSPVKMGDIVAKNVLGTFINFIATRSL